MLGRPLCLQVSMSRPKYVAVCVCGCVCIWGAARLARPHPGDSGLWHAPYAASGRTKPPAQGLGIQPESQADTPSQVSPCLPGQSHLKGS